jgi:serine/threonine protein kinase
VRSEDAGTYGGSTVAGTFEYMAPEQFAGEAAPAADLWALGVVGIELLTRRRPGTLRTGQHGYDWERHAQAPAEVRALFGRWLEPEPGRRGTAREALEELTRLLHVLPQDAQPPRTPRPAAPAPKVEIPNLARGSAVAGKLAALERERQRQEEAAARAQAETQRLERERGEREARATAERQARDARLAAEKKALEEERARLTAEYARHVAEALTAARRQVAPRARAEWGAVVEFLRKASQDGALPGARSPRSWWASASTRWSSIWRPRHGRWRGGCGGRPRQRPGRRTPAPASGSRCRSEVSAWPSPACASGSRSRSPS